MKKNGIIMVCDESGAKGYADQREAYYGEVGVVAGFFVRQGTQLTELNNTLSQIYKKISGTSISKFHISALPEGEQHEMRNKTFAVLQAKMIPLSFGAIYVDAFNKVFEETKNRYLGIVKKARVKDIGLTKNYATPRLQAELFFAFLGKVIDFIIVTKTETFSILVLTDQIDESIKREYQKQITRFQSPFSPITKIWNEFDYETKATAKRNITVHIKSENPFYPMLQAIKCSVAVAHNSLTVAADILANSIRHCLEVFATESALGYLNTRTAIQNHPLRDQFVGMHIDLAHVPAIDKRYRHRERT